MLGNVYSLHTLVVENKTSTLFYAYIINRLLITSFDAKRTSQPIFRPILGLFLQVSNKRDQQLQRETVMSTLLKNYKVEYPNQELMKEAEVFFNKINDDVKY